MLPHFRRSTNSLVCPAEKAVLIMISTEHSWIYKGGGKAEVFAERVPVSRLIRLDKIWSVTGLEPIRSRYTYAFRWALCVQWSDDKSWELCSNTGVSGGPHTETVQSHLISHKTYILRHKVQPELFAFKDSVRTALWTHPVSLITQIHKSHVTLSFAVNLSLQATCCAAALH